MDISHLFPKRLYMNKEQGTCSHITDFILVGSIRKGCTHPRLMLHMHLFKKNLENVVFVLNTKALNMVVTGSIYKR